MNIEDIRRVLILGAGTMGRQIALQCSMYGYEVNLYDINPQALENAVAQIKTYADYMVKKEHLTREDADAALVRIVPGSDPEKAVIDVDLISESIPEDPKLKGEVFAQFNKLCPAHTIFTTNTSTLLPSMFAETTGRPAQFSALHFHQIVWVNNVVDVAAHPGTSQETLSLIRTFAKRIGQVPIVLKKESPFYLFNAMLRALCDEAIKLALNNVASVEDIDRAWIGITKMPFGPFGILDTIGLDLAWEVESYWGKILDSSQMQKNAEFIKDYVDKGHLGVKSGQGFYTYPNPAYRQAGFVAGE